jgi:hypothetical protein
MTSIMDLENKIATLSITWYSDITQSITDAQITKIIYYYYTSIHTQ